MKNLAVFFPGLGYSFDKPLMYYHIQLCRQLGYSEQINILYTSSLTDIIGDSEKINQCCDIIYSQAEQALDGVNFDEYDNIVFVSKSIGTMVAARYEQEHNINCKQILMTPLTETFNYTVKHGIYFSGTADPWINLAEIPQDIMDSDRMTVVHNANHSLEIGNAIANIALCDMVVKKSKSLLG